MPSRDEKRRLKELRNYPQQVEAAEYRDGRFYIIDSFFGMVVLNDMWQPYSGFATQYNEHEFNRMVAQARLLLKEQAENKAKAEAEKAQRDWERGKNALPKEKKGRKGRGRFYPYEE